MLGFPTYRFLPVLLFICACPSDDTVPTPLDTETAGNETGEITSGPTGDGSTMMGPTGPGSVPTTTEPDGQTSAGTGGGDGPTTDEPAAGCGPPCTGHSTHEAAVFLQGTGANFSCVKKIEGTLYIGADADPAEIASLASLVEVDGDVTIAGNLALTDLVGLECLQDVHSLKITGMPQLSDLGALARLRSAPVLELEGLGITALPQFAPEFAGLSMLALSNNPALVDLHAAATWGAGPGLELTIGNNALLPTLVGLSGLLADNGANPVGIRLEDLPKLTSLAGLEPVVAADLHFERLPQVSDFEPLGGLTVGGQITFNRMPAIVDLGGLDNLTSVGTFTIGECVHPGSGGMDSLKSLAGLDRLVSIDHFALANNDKLISLAGAPKLAELDAFAAANNPILSLAAYESFVAGFDPTPSGCMGDLERCPCFNINPG
ncbi:hypothetical protein [Nannocystis sp. SCPEA4]|uniref:hypothetical protein n=1 Tax=Nannocystis sp. SCPEA4 TaxID=2996787 RepID=UPI0022721867|nr:hypothetical protein [Nannocystis sp. SCPEA4]MCY1054237.1 hypothetical protein [Nannocystis sp. SCPEA4]